MLGQRVPRRPCQARRLKLIEDQIVALLRDHNVLGICLVEVGHPGVGLTQGCSARMEARIQAAWRRAGAAEHGPGQVFWASSDEALLSVFRCRTGPRGAAKHGVPEAHFRVDVVSHRLVSHLDPLDTWRCAQVIEIQLVDEKSLVEPEAVTLINCHLSSGKHQLTDRCRGECLPRLMNLGRQGQAGGRFLLGTDLNTARTTLAALTRSGTGQQPRFAFADLTRKEKHGDIVVGCGLHLVQENNSVKNRDSGHDCVVATWRRKGGAAEHAVSSASSSSMIGHRQTRAVEPASGAWHREKTLPPVASRPVASR